MKVSNSVKRTVEGGPIKFFLDFFEILAVGAAIRNSPIKRPNGYEKRGRRHLKRSEGLG